ncbi:hypothetical protein OGAPHI_003725 [Ogataea philodendri]|uniref:Uncharacterized protein n=1 Tax=Ogataea philodendri TaxID=1378263 RepID=A0A9P8T4R6_9ASCO|nr:uncharacterized protein OGAPHI_003725 [Ogataea philodendri]KAH3665539.1 hypothetical protein OGAPHI_003725 [Ogataea philodendri]
MLEVGQVLKNGVLDMRRLAVVFDGHADGFECVHFDRHNFGTVWVLEQGVDWVKKQGSSKKVALRSSFHQQIKFQFEDVDHGYQYAFNHVVCLVPVLFTIWQLQIHLLVPHIHENHVDQVSVQFEEPSMGSEEIHVCGVDDLVGVVCLTSQRT